MNHDMNDCQEAFRFISTFVYSTKYDGSIRSGLRYNQRVDDVLGHQDVEKDWKAVLNLPEVGKKSEQTMGKDDEKAMESSNMDVLEQGENNIFFIIIYLNFNFNFNALTNQKLCH